MASMNQITKRATIDENDQTTKKPKRSEIFPGSVGMSSNSKLIKYKVPSRSSSLLAPIIRLTGHQGQVTSCSYSPNGENFASADSMGHICKFFLLF